MEILRSYLWYGVASFVPTYGTEPINITTECVLNMSGITKRLKVAILKSATYRYSPMAKSDGLGTRLVVLLIWAVSCFGAIHCSRHSAV